MSVTSKLDGILNALPLPRALHQRILDMSTGSTVYLGNAGKTFLVRIAGAGIGFGLQVLLARLLSLNDYGLYATFWTWLFVAAQIGALGFNDSSLRFMPRYLSRGRFADAQAFLTIGYWVVVAGSLAVAGLGLFALWGLSILETTADVRWLLLTLFFAGIPFLAFELYLEGIARSFGWFVLATAPGYVVRPIALGLTVIAVALSGLRLDAATALGLAIAITGAVTFTQAMLLRRHIRSQIGLPRPTARPSHKRLRLWLAATLPLTIVYGVEDIYLVSDVLILGLIADPSEVAVYFAAVRLMAFAGYVHYAFMLISSREFSIARASLDHRQLQQRVTKATWWTFWLTLPAVLATVGLGYPLLAMFGTDYVAGYGALAILGVGLLARASVGQAGDLLIVLGYQKDGLVVAIISLGMNMLLAVALVPILGILGAAISTACSQVMRAVALSYLVKRRTKLETLVFRNHRRAAQSELQASV